MHFHCNVFQWGIKNVRPATMNNNSNELLFYPHNIVVKKCSSSSDNVNDPYAKLWFPGAIKEMIIKVFNLMSIINKTRHVSWHETCTCKCRLDANVYNNKKSWNNDKCKFECKKMIDKGICDDRLICNTSICECKCDTLCDVGKYLCYENCKCRNKLIDKLVLEWEDGILNAIPLKTINTISITEKNNCLIYIMLLIIMCLILLAIISVSCYYYHTRYWLKKGKSMPIYKWVV